MLPSKLLGASLSAIALAGSLTVLHRAEPSPGPSSTAALETAVSEVVSPSAPRSVSALSMGPPRARDRRDLSAYKGLGTWVDAYDFSREKNPGKTPSTSPADVDKMAAKGIKTLYLQASKIDSDTPNLLLSQDLLGQFLTRAHAKNIRVVAWYLPKFLDATSDWNHVKAVLDFRASGQGFDSFGLDIESREQQNLQARNTRLVNLSNKIRSYVGNRMPLSAIVLPPVVTDVINTQYWPQFPWAGIKNAYDVWQPMAYYTNRTVSSGYRDPYRYITENIRLLRNNLRSQTAPVHAVGGIGDTSTTEDYKAYVRGLRAQRSIGGSIYDWATCRNAAWWVLHGVPS